MGSNVYAAEDKAKTWVNCTTTTCAYKEGVRDWFDGLCFRARPDYPDKLEKAWIRGWHDGQLR
jgi:hypothetical protein